MICKVTKKKIRPFMSFGKMPIANGFLNKNEFRKEHFFKMEVGFSSDISLFQLNDHPKPKMMFNKDYPFFTGSSKGMEAHFREYANWIKKKYIKNKRILIEIGSNDGTFLKNFKKNKISSIGIEPSSNVAKIARKKGINTKNYFFNSKNVKKLKRFYKKTDLICAANAICHIPDIPDLIKGIDYLLGKKGLFIFEEPYLGSMYEKTSYDQIYDEHIFIFSVSSVMKIFKLYGFDLVNVVPQKTHGGSMRYVVGRSGEHVIDKNVLRLLQKEKRKKIDSIDGCLRFKKKCEISKNRLRSKIHRILKKGKKIAGYAATSKSTTILNYCNINSNHIDFICDTTPNKINTFTPGTHIPVVSVKHFKDNIPDYTFLFAWNHKKEIFKKERKILKRTKWFAHVKI